MSNKIPLAKHGDRVGAFMSADDKTVYLLGYGVYEGDEPVPYLDDLTFERAEKIAHDRLKEAGMKEWPEGLDTVEKRREQFDAFKQSPMYLFERTHPKIVLDHGDVVWGNECHFGPEDMVKKLVADRRIQLVILSRKPNGEPDQEMMAGSA